MLRTLATPKWVALTILGVVVIIAFGALSWWQWQRAQRDESVAAAVPVSDVFVPGQPLDPQDYGARVTVTGTYDADHQVLVKHGTSGFWVVTPLRPAEGLPIPVARADVAAPDSPAVSAVAQGVVTVTGAAQPFEGDPGTASTLPTGQTELLTETGLALPYDVVPGWVAMETQTPAPAVAAPLVPPPIGPSAGAPLRLQNLSYAFQWAVFAGFVVFFWWRMLRDDVGGATASAPPEQSEPVREVY